MLMSRDEIIADVEEQIRKGGGHYSDWCVGVVEDPRELTDTGSLGDDKGALLVYREAFTPGVARAVRDHFVTECATDAGAVTEGKTGRIVYALKKTSHADRSGSERAHPFAPRRRAA